MIGLVVGMMWVCGPKKCPNGTLAADLRFDTWLKTLSAIYISLDWLNGSVALSACSNPAVSLQLLLKRTVSHTHIIELRSDQLYTLYTAS